MANGNSSVNAVARWKEMNAAAMRGRPEKMVGRAELMCERALAALRGNGKTGKAEEALEWLGRDARVRRALEVGRHIPHAGSIAGLPALAGRFDNYEMYGKGSADPSGLRVELIAGGLVFHRAEDIRAAAENHRFDGRKISEENLRSIIERAAVGASEEELGRAAFIALVALIERGDLGQADMVIKDFRLGPRQVGDAAIIAYLGKIHPNLVGRGMEGFVPPPVLPRPEVLDGLVSAHPGCLERFGVGWLAEWGRMGAPGDVAAEAEK